MSRQRRKGPPVAEDLGAQLLAGLKQSAKKPNNNLYKPHHKQLAFHASPKVGRQYIGGNRSGKTVGGINEDIYWLRGSHPFREVPEPPVYGRLTTVDFKNGVNKIILPNLRQWIPPSLLINGSWEDSWNAQAHTLFLANGSQLEVMSYEQDLDKFAGVPRHFIHFDEEPPKDIFGECKARLVDYGGSWWMTMTPVEGMTWTLTDIYDPSYKGDNPLIDVIQVSTYDNAANLKEGAIDVLLEGLSEDDKKIRGQGAYVAVSGLVFKHFDTDVHVIPSRIPPRDWTHYLSLDAGYNNPTAIEFHAVASDGTVVTYKEHYRSEWTVEQHAKEALRIKQELMEEHGIEIYLQVADPAIKQRSQVTGLSTQIEYVNHGLVLTTPGSRDVASGLDKMNNYLRTRKWFITEDCPNLIREMRMYRRGSFASSKVAEKNNKQEKPLKKDDHAIDSTRYFFVFQPTLEVEKEIEKGLRTRDEALTLLDVGTTFDHRRPFRVDPNFNSQPHENQYVYAVDEYTGEF